MASNDLQLNVKPPRNTQDHDTQTQTVKRYKSSRDTLIIAY